MNDLEKKVTTFLTPYLSLLNSKQHTILTWAQSLDAKIAPSSTIRYPLSSWETWYMTHLIRRQSDAILIGAQTAVTDDPSLIGEMNFSIGLMIAKVPSGGIGSKWRLAPFEEQPRAIILDPTCRAPLKKMLYRVSKKQAPAPWIFCRDDVQKSEENYVPMKTYHDGKFKWEDILSTLSAKGANFIMIEGGGVVINDVLSCRIVDVIIVSISPVLLGCGGVGVLPVLGKPEWLEDVQTIVLGKDVVVAGRIRRDDMTQKQ
jgi:2,5-diamino-6-(ribosylamino)-4(3H)-pyrimidinone 5'-phosphate reductase